MVSEQHYSAMVQAWPTPCLIVLPDAPVFTVVNASDSYLSLAMVSRQELVGQSFFDVFPDNPYLSDSEWRNAFDDVLVQKRPVKMAPEKFAFPLAGTPTRLAFKYLEVTNAPVLDENGEVRYIIRTMNDVTEAIHHERFLQETQQVVRLGSWEVNLADQTVIWSDGLRQIFEVSNDFRPDINSSLAFFIDPTARQEFVAGFKKAMEDGTFFRNTLPIETGRGGKRWLLTVGKADMVNGLCVRVFGITKDITERKETEEALAISERNFQNLVQTIDGIVWEADAEIMKINFVSDKIESILGYTAQECLAEPDFWRNHLYEADRESASTLFRQKIRELTNFTMDYRMIRKDGDIVWIKDIVSVIRGSGKPKWLRGIMVDVTETKRLESLDRLEKTILELNAQRTVCLAQILSDYLIGIEALFPGAKCSIHRVLENILRCWAAPSLPENYIQAIQQLPADDSNPCGLAVHSKKPVITSDIGNAPQQVSYKHEALHHGLKSSWSFPIVASGGEPMAVLTVYYRHVKRPNPDELAIIGRTVALLKIILENRKNADRVLETSLMMTQGQELARFGNWQWDLETDKLSWSKTLYDIFGLNTDFTPTFDTYLLRVHDNDREKVRAIMQSVADAGENRVFEERVIRPDGEVRYLKSWARRMSSHEGVPQKVIGASLDITDSKLAEIQLKKLYKQLELQVKQIAASEKKYSNLFHLSPQPMWLYDLETYRFLDVNKAAVKHYGYTREEFLAMTIMDVRPPDEIPKVQEAVKFSRQHDELFCKGVHMHQKKDGTVMHVEVIRNIIRFQGREAEVVLINDITEKLNYIEAIESQNSKLQEIAWLQSHVVRAPLARIMGLIDLIQHFPEPAIQHSELLDAINRAAVELDNVIRSITDKAEQINITS